MRLVLLCVVWVLVAACAGAPAPVRSGVGEAPEEGAGLRYAPDRVVWPALEGELSAPPLGGIALEDGGGRRWTLWTRPGAQIRVEDALRSLPKGSPAGSLSVQGLRAQGGRLELAPGDGVSGERWVLLRAEGDGPPTRRVVGWWGPGGEGLAAGVEGPVWAVRLTSAAAPPRALRVQVEAPGCEAEAEAMRGELSRLLSGVTAGVEWVEGGADAALRVRCEGGAWREVEVEGRSGRLVRTPYWSPSVLTLPGAEGAAPVAAALASLGREPQAALWLLRAPGEGAWSRRLLGALALEAGWFEAVEAVLDGDNGEVAALLRGGARFGGGGAGLGELVKLKGEGAESRYRAASARALAALRASRPEEARAALAEAPPEGAWGVEWLLARGQMALLTGSPALAEEALGALKGREGEWSRAQRAGVSRLQGLVAAAQGRQEEALKALEASAEGFEALGDHGQAARSWQQAASLGLAAEQDEGRWERAQRAAERAQEPDLAAQIGAARYLRYAEARAGDEAPPGDAPSRLEEVLGLCRRAQRHDLAAAALRYSLLLMPAEAELGARQRRVLEALSEAHAGGERGELVLLLGLLSRLQAAGFQYDRAEQSLRYAIAFSEAMGDAELKQVLEGELKALEAQ